MRKMSDAEKKVRAEHGSPQYRMRGSGFIHETHGYRFRVKVYRNPKWLDSGDYATVCADGGYDDLRFCWGADDNGIRYYAGELYMNNLFPGANFGKPLKTHEISKLLMASIISHLESGWVVDNDDTGETK